MLSKILLDIKIYAFLDLTSYFLDLVHKTLFVWTPKMV